MRVSEYYELGRSQPTLDFLDVHIDTDVRAYIDPTAIRVQQSDWAHTCQALLQSFFTEVLDAIRVGDVTRARRLMIPLSEPNEVHLGFSCGESRGRGFGEKAALDFMESVRKSRAARSGLLADLEDTALLIDGIGDDIISDITTNIIRGALIGYTQRACAYYGIGVENQYCGLIWNPDGLEWQEGYAPLPRARDDLLLLVPKSIVRLHLTVDSDKYYNRQIAPRLEAVEVDAKSPLVTVLKNGSVKVPRDELRKKYPASKLAIVEYSERFPDALAGYKKSLTKAETPLLSHRIMHERFGAQAPDYQQLLDSVLAVPPGNAGATVYHRACEKLLTALFYPFLANMELEKEIHDGRKRIDICYDNLASQGTFFWLSANYGAGVVPVECKNYSRDLENPELDQISGRFSDRRGWVGMIVFRSCLDKDLFLDRCRDTARDGRGYIIALDDTDLSELVRERRSVAMKPEREQAFFKLIRERVDKLIT